MSAHEPEVVRSVVSVQRIMDALRLYFWYEPPQLRYQEYRPPPTLWGGVGADAPDDSLGYNALGVAGSYSSSRIVNNSTDTMNTFNGTFERPFVFGDTYDSRTRSASNQNLADTDDASVEVSKG